MTETVKVINEGHRDIHCPEWGYGHLVRIASGPREGRIIRVFHDLPLAIDTKLETERIGGLYRVKT